MQKDNSERYGTITRLIHQLTLALFIGLIATVTAWKIDEHNYQLVPLHALLGTGVLLFAIVRLIRSIWLNRYRPMNTLFAKSGHILLILLSIIVPVIGIIRQMGMDDNHQVKIQWAVDLGNQWHGELAILLILLIFGHIFMALWHYFKGKSVFGRMWGHQGVKK